MLPQILTLVKRLKTMFSRLNANFCMEIYGEDWFAMLLKSNLHYKSCNLSVGIAGGKSPDKFISFFNKYKQNYPNINFVLIDDRDVDEFSIKSNYGQLRRSLDKDFTIVRPHELFVNKTAECPLDLLILGMGEDGHIASIFPEVSDNTLIHSGCVIKTPPVGTPRVVRYSLSEKTLLQASKVILVVRGKVKAKILDYMLANSLLNYPVVRLVTRHPDLVICRI